MGPTAVLDTGKVEIVIISNMSSRTTWRPSRRWASTRPSKRYLMLKSRVHWRAGLRSLAGAVVECAGTGVCTSDYAALHFQHVRRPIYPLESGRLMAREVR
jgi:microcystin degradation protein MlrC